MINFYYGIPRVPGNSRETSGLPRIYVCIPYLYVVAFHYGWSRGLGKDLTIVAHFGQTPSSGVINDYE